MALRFIVDTQLPLSLCKLLRANGHDVLHTYECEDKEYTTDRRIREIAVQEERIIVTKDTDFHDYYIVKGAPPKVLLLKLGNCSNKDLLSSIEKHLPAISNYFEVQSETFVIVWKDFIALI
jgi:predicted nuclease of predicted toxin-antitoxin system